MGHDPELDCVIIGYNELPFERYEGFLRGYGEDSEAYRDLKFSFVDVGGRKMDYNGLLNYAVASSGPEGEQLVAAREFKSGDMPNLAAAYLTHYLTRRGFAARFVNLFQYEKELLLEYLAAGPVCVAITTTFYVVNLPVIEMVEFIRQHNREVKIVVGGPLVANHARQNQGEQLRAALDDIGADIYIIEGQGEETLARVVDCLRRGGDLGTVPNLAYHDGGRLVRTGSRAEENSLDDNFIDWRAFAGMEPGRTIQTRTARSCAFKCSFCNYPTRAGALTLLGVESLERELDSMLELGEVQNVVFIDDTFNVPFPRFKEICRMMIRRKYPFHWYSYFRCSNSDEEAIELMAESGCKGVFLGIESGSPSVLKNMNKAATVEKYDQGITWLRRAGITTFASFITGFPGETDETVAETVDFIRRTRPDFYRSQVWYCEPGTPIQRERATYDIQGEGFVWSHATMDSLEAMDHIDRMFLTIEESQWLPQWSFDFWVIPYLAGRGLAAEQFKEFMTGANRLLRLEIASLPAAQKAALQNEHVQELIERARGWNLTA